MARCLAAPLLGSLLGCAGTAVEVEPAPEQTTPTSEAPAVAAPAKPRPTRRPAATPSPAPTLSPNCQAPLQAIEEVSRLLVVAATHATHSKACVDGPGRRVAIDQVLVCPAPALGSKLRAYDASYRVTVFPEGDTRACAPDCPQMQPQSSEHTMNFRFKGDGNRFTVLVPDRVAGLPDDASAPGSAHDGDCYGSSGAFVPTPIELR